MEQQRTHKKARLQEGDDRHSQTTSHEKRREEAVYLVKYGYEAFKHLPEWHDDEEVALAAIHRDSWHFEFVSARLKSDKDFFLSLLATGKANVCDLLPYVSEALHADREIVLEAVRQNCWALCFASVELRSDREIVMEAVRQDGMALHFASEEIRADREVVTAAVRKNGWALRDTAEALRADRDIVLTAVLQDGEALRFAAEEMRADRDVVCTAVLQDGLALQFASEELRGDRDVVCTAVRKAGSALQFASAELRADREVVMEAVQKTGWALQFASRALRGVHEIVLVAVRQHGQFLRYASEEMRGDQEVVLVAIENAEELYWVKELAVRHMSDDLQNDPVVAGALFRNGLCLRRESEIMDRLEKVLHAVRALPEDIVENVVLDQESVVEFSRRWEGLVWNKIWMALQLEPPGMQGTGRLFAELSGLPLELRQAKELRDFAPLVGAVLSFPDRDWRDIKSYAHG